MRYLPLDIADEWNVEDRQPGYQFFPHRLRGEGFYLACFKKEGLAGVEKQKKRERASKLSAISRKDHAIIASWVKDAEQLHFFYTQEGEVAFLPKSHLQWCEQLASKLGKVKFGTKLGRIKKQLLIPPLSWL